MHAGRKGGERREQDVAHGACTPGSRRACRRACAAHSTCPPCCGLSPASPHPPGPPPPRAALPRLQQTRQPTVGRCTGEQALQEAADAATAAVPSPWQTTNMGVRQPAGHRPLLWPPLTHRRLAPGLALHLAALTWRRVHGTQHVVHDRHAAKQHRHARQLAQLRPAGGRGRRGHQVKQVGSQPAGGWQIPGSCSSSGGPALPWPLCTAASPAGMLARCIVQWRHSSPATPDPATHQWKASGSSAPATCASVSATCRALRRRMKSPAV